MVNIRERFFSGLSGIQLPMARYDYPEPFQQQPRLAYYATLFNSIEVNSCFYTIPQESTIRKWASITPDSFRFTFKLYKEITHCKDFRYDPEHVNRFLQVISTAAEKFGCLLIQFPPKLPSGHLEQLHELLNLIRSINKLPQWRIAVEFRNKHWYNEELFGLLEDHKVALVRQDIPASATPAVVIPNVEFAYLRYHGPTGRYDGSYSDDHLAAQRELIAEQLSEGKSVFAYFNNTKGSAYNNLSSLNHLMKEV